MKAVLLRFWKRSKWVILAVAAVALGVLGVVLRGLVFREPPEGKKVDVLPEVHEAIKEKVQQAEEAALVSRVEARVQAETQTQALQEVMKVEDGAERRRRLAAMLRGL
jgi:hypothetical protein